LGVGVAGSMCVVSMQPAEAILCHTSMKRETISQRGPVPPGNRNAAMLGTLPEANGLLGRANQGQWKIRKVYCRECRYAIRKQEFEKAQLASDRNPLRRKRLWHE
jgi:hypothetical protein